MDGKVNSFFRKWLRLPWCLDCTEHKSQGSLRLEVDAQTEVDQAIGRLQHQEVVGRVQEGRAGLGWGEAPRFWSKAKKGRRWWWQRWVARTEEERFKIKAVPKGRRRSWTTSEGVGNRNIRWTDQLKIPQARFSFLIHSTYDTLPCPWNLHQWFGSEESCSFCSTPNTLSGCKTTLCQGCYRWRHDQVLRKLAEVVKGQRQGSKGSPPAGNHTSFVTEDGGGGGGDTRLFSLDQEWDMRVDLDRQLHFPTEITTTSL